MKKIKFLEHPFLIKSTIISFLIFLFYYFIVFKFDIFLNNMGILNNKELIIGSLFILIYSSILGCCLLCSAFCLFTYGPKIAKKIFEFIRFTDRCINKKQKKFNKKFPDFLNDIKACGSCLGMIILFLLFIGVFLLIPSPPISSMSIMSVLLLIYLITH